MYRGHHYCQGNEKFVHNFQRLFEEGCLEMLLAEDIFTEDTIEEPQNIKIMTEFVNMVAGMKPKQIDELVARRKSSQ